MKRAPINSVVSNIRDADHEHKVKWVSNLMSGMRPGGVWVVPRSISCVLVLSVDPPIARVRSIVKDDNLVRLLTAAGWSVQVINVGEIPHE